MKKIYLITLPLAIMLVTTGCSKDFLKRYEDRIEGGTWRIHDIRTFGIGSRYSLAFTEGTFTFLGGGRLEYVNGAGDFYQGTWDMRRDYLPGEGREVRTLQISVVNFQTQDVLAEYFDEITFTGTNRFRAMIYGNNRTYIYIFKR